MTRRAGEFGLSQEDIFFAPSPSPGWFRAGGMTLSSQNVYGAEGIAKPAMVVPDYLEAAERRIDELTGLKPNWDGYGGVAVADTTRDTAIRLLCTVVSERDVLPSIIPGTGGSLNFEWRRHGEEFEIEIDPSGRVIAYYRKDDGEDWERDYSAVEPRVGDLIARFAG